MRRHLRVPVCGARVRAFACAPHAHARMRAYGQRVREQPVCARARAHVCICACERVCVHVRVCACAPDEEDALPLGSDAPQRSARALEPARSQLRVVLTRATH
eukprot:6211734-Pleurochrysis_carterae.AAC.2